ncbi:unnamed protein product [Caretta caretta]
MKRSAQSVSAPCPVSTKQVETDYTPKEVMARLSKTKNTAPGKDSVPYGLLKKQDPGCLVLATLFNQCKRFCWTPSSCKKAMTVLVYRKGERDDPSNWRPISLCSTMYKLYASCLVSRIGPLLRAISNGTDGFNLHGERVSVLAYADELVLTADDPENLQRMLDATSRAADWMGLRFNAKKCATLHIDGSKRDSMQTTGFRIQGEPVIPLAEGQVY